jgi:hypothetical protein
MQVEDLIISEDKHLSDFLLIYVNKRYKDCVKIQYKTTTMHDEWSLNKRGGDQIKGGILNIAIITKSNGKEICSFECPIQPRDDGDRYSEGIFYYTDNDYILQYADNQIWFKVIGTLIKHVMSILIPMANGYDFSNFNSESVCWSSAYKEVNPKYHEMSRLNEFQYDGKDSKFHGYNCVQAS